ncbi:HIT domain-containing protein [Candidatus Babeliales bacterium]|nr:HIT domain-containing protein [Candidatus Babeliales bacterium]
MSHKNCVFCDIITGKIHAEKVAETPQLIVIKDTNPKAPTHLLIMPKKHIVTMADVANRDKDLAFAMFAIVEELAKNLDAPQAFNIISNNGAEAGQSVLHMHWHFISGKNIYLGDFKL